MHMQKFKIALFVYDHPSNAYFFLTKSQMTPKYISSVRSRINLIVLFELLSPLM